MLLALVFPLFILFPLLYSSSLAAAQVIHDDYPLFVQGALENATATDGTYNTGGTITVNGFTAKVPKNLLVQFPAAWVPWKDFVANKADFLGFETLVRPAPIPRSSGWRLMKLPHRSWATPS